MPILLTALCVAVLDGLYPMVLYFYRFHWGVAQRVMQSVAAGVLGKASFDGGAATAMLGVALHFTIALIWTSIYVMIVRRLPVVARLTRTRKGTAIVAAIYGAFVWLWMNYVVIALSRATVSSAAHWPFWSQLAWHVVGVGPAIAFLSERSRAPAARGETGAGSYGTPASSPI